MPADALELAQQALAAYGLGGSRVGPLGPSQNTNFQVETPGGERLVLRLHRGAHDVDTLESESVWLRFLREAALSVPEPVALPSGSHVLNLGGHLISLLRWVEGEVYGGLNPSQARLAGAAMAELHAQAERFKPPPGFRRPRYDENYFRGQLDVLGALPLFSAIDKELQRRAVSKAVAVLDESGPGFGLVHADFQPGNLVFYGDEARVIDFDRLGLGAWGFDIAAALGFLDESGGAAFLEGFRSIKPLPPRFEDRLEGFMTLAYLDNLAFLSPQPEEARFVETDMWPYLREKLARFVGF